MNITKKDALFYLDVIDSIHAPDFREKRKERVRVSQSISGRTQIRKTKPINLILRRKDKDEQASRDYERIIRVVVNYFDLLNQDEFDVMNYRYGIGHDYHTYPQIAEIKGCTSSWVSALMNKAESKIAKQIKQDFDL